jgi:hypothetical protein
MYDFAQDLVRSSEWLFCGTNAGAGNRRALLAIMALLCIWLLTRAYEVQWGGKRDARQGAWTVGLGAQNHLIG